MGNRDIFMAKYSAFSPYRLREREMGFPTPIGAEDAMAKSLYCGMKPIASWDFDRGKTVPTGGVFNLEFSPDGAMLVAACEKKSIQIFDPLTHQKIHSVNGAHSDCVNCVKFLDARMFATCSDDTTIALWDVRNLKKKIRTLLGHSKWVKNIEFSVKDKLLVTSGLDGSIYTWDINSYTEYNLVYQKVFHTSSLMRCRLSPDARQMVMCTTGGLLIIIHDLNLSTLAQDLHGFKPNLYRLMQMSQQLIPIAAMYDHLFDSSRRENRVEFVSDFPEGNDAEVVSALQIHPQGWSALSRNISHDDRSEWTCIHDIQPRGEEKGVARDTCRGPPRSSPSTSPVPVSVPALTPAAAPRRLTPRRMPARARLRPLARTHSRPHLLSGISPSAGTSSARSRPEPEPEAGPSSAAGDARSYRSASPPPAPHAPAPAPAPAFTAAARLAGNLSSIQNDVWEASITVKQNRMLQELYSSGVYRGQVRRNFNMQRITGINTGITPPGALRPRTPASHDLAHRHDLADSLSPSTSGHTSRDIATEEASSTRHYIRQNQERLLYYVEETNEGKGFIKELCYSADGRIVCSPFGRGMRLLALNEDCSELSHCVQDFSGPRLMVDVGQSLGIHQDLVVSSRFSPRYHMLVTGCLEGKIVWYQPYSGEALY